MPIHAPSDEQASALLRDLVALPSPSGQERAAAECAVATLRAWGLEAEVDKAGNAVARAGDGPTRVLLLGHIDTVPGVVPVRMEGGHLYGRGAVDAKGPLAAFFMALARAAAQPELLAGLSVTVVGAVEEEAASSKGARFVAATYPAPDLIVIGEPSNWDRVTLGYKGRLLVDYALERPMAHTAGQQRSVCEEAVAYWLQVQRWAQDVNTGREGLFATVDPSLRAIRSASDGLAERVEMLIGLRLPPDLDADMLRRDLGAWAGDACVTTRGYERAIRADKRSPLAAAFTAAIRAEGGRPAFVNKTGTSDMNVLGHHWACPIVAYGPGDSSLDHTPDEHIALDEYLAAIRVLICVLPRLKPR